MTECSLYERAEFRAAAGAEFRPGGLDLTEELAGLCRLRPGQRVLDIGCGAGSTVSYLNHTLGIAAVGLDESLGFLEEARLRDPAGEWVIGSAEELPFDDGGFEAVFCECVLSLVEDPDRVLSEIRRVLRSGGYLAVSDMYFRRPERAPLLGGAPRASCLAGATSREIGISRVEQAGFTVTHWSDRSERLKVLAARMVFAHRSVDSFWESLLGRRGDGQDQPAPHQLAAAQPGYYLLVGMAGVPSDGTGRF